MQSKENPRLWGITKVSPDSSLSPSLNRVTNAASFISGRIAPGELVTIFGTGLGPEKGVSFTLDPITNTVPTNLGGTEVYIRGYAAPVLYASSTQVNAIAPYDIGPFQDFTAQVSYQGVLTTSTQSGAETTPALFTANGSGSGQAAALNLNGTVPDSTHPATRGSYVSLYFTGGGYTSRRDPIGSVNGSQLNRYINPVSVTVGGVPATVTFAGAAPGLVTGVGQINIKLADNTPTGDAIPVIVTVGNTSSTASVSIAVQ